MKYPVLAASAFLLAACNQSPSDLVTVSPKDSRSTSPTSFSVATSGYNTVGSHTFTVPAGVTSLTVFAVGAGGGGSNNHPGGSGAMVTATLAVTPGQVLDLFVGGRSGPGTNWNVGGGGSTTISSGGAPLVIAGGGGGAGRDRAGGSAGAPDGSGFPGVSGGVVACGSRCSTTGTGGAGGAGGIGGLGGTSSGGWPAGQKGGNGNGGNGGNSATAGGPGGSGTGFGGDAGYYGGGGGGGYGGGGGGGSGSGGGGGGSYGPVGTTFAVYANGGPVAQPGGDGSIKFIYEEAPPPPPPPAVTCPEGYTEGAAFESFVVNANGVSSPVFNPPAFTPLIAGRPYLAKATGTYSYHFWRSDTWADAHYLTGNNWTTPEGPLPSFGLAIDEVKPDWGPYNSSHEYKVIFYGTGGPQTFRIQDNAYEDNSGGLNVTLYTCTPNSLPTTTSVTFGAGPFVYNGSAFTATASVDPAEAGAATITYSGDCVNAGGSCTATATFAGSGNYLPSSASTGIVIAKAATSTSVTFGAGPFIYTGSAFTATSSVSPAAAGSATIAYSGDCVYAGNTCSATATYAGNANYLASGASTGIVIKYPVATSSEQCKKGGWQYATDDLGNLFKNQGDCVSYVATKGKNKGAIAP